MKQAITYQDIFLSLGEVISLEELEITQSPNQHGQLILSAVLDGEWEERDGYEMPKTVLVYYRQEEREKFLFKGTIIDSQVKRVGNHRAIRLKAWDATQVLDRKRKTRSFQNLSRTSHSLVSEIMEDYPGAVCFPNLPEEPIGQIWFQYEETDWEFLCRFASHYGDSLYADATHETARFQVGMSAQDIEVDWEEFPYYIHKDWERYDKLSENGFPQLQPEEFIGYVIDSYEIYLLGSRLWFKGIPWYIGKLTRKLTAGILVCTYTLRQKGAMGAIKQYNRRIRGISVEGTIAQMQRDRVRVTLQGDMTREQGTYWFPFSTVAASADGSGWYSMPEEGDSIRVYFPTWDEKEGYVITKHNSHIPSTTTVSGLGRGEDLSNRDFLPVQESPFLAERESGSLLVTEAPQSVIKKGSGSLLAAEEPQSLRTKGSKNLLAEEDSQLLHVKKNKKSESTLTEVEGNIGRQKEILEDGEQKQDSALKQIEITDSFVEQYIKALLGGMVADSLFLPEEIDFSDRSFTSGETTTSNIPPFPTGEATAFPTPSSLAGGAMASPAPPSPTGEAEGENPMDDPLKRNIFTQDGNSIRLLPKGIFLTAGEASLSLLKNGEVHFVAPGGISIQAGESLVMTGENVVLETATRAELQSEADAQIVLGQFGIFLEAKEIHEN